MSDSASDSLMSVLLRAKKHNKILNNNKMQWIVIEILKGLMALHGNGILH